MKESALSPQQQDQFEFKKIMMDPFFFESKRFSVGSKFATIAIKAVFVASFHHDHNEDYPKDLPYNRAP